MTEYGVGDGGQSVDGCHFGGCGFHFCFFESHSCQHWSHWVSMQHFKIAILNFRSSVQQSLLTTYEHTSGLLEPVGSKALREQLGNQVTRQFQNQSQNPHDAKLIQQTSCPEISPNRFDRGNPCGERPTHERWWS